MRYDLYAKVHDDEKEKYSICHYTDKSVIADYIGEIISAGYMVYADKVYLLHSIEYFRIKEVE